MEIYYVWFIYIATILIVCLLMWHKMVLGAPPMTSLLVASVLGLISLFVTMAFVDFSDLDENEEFWGSVLIWVAILMPIFFLIACIVRKEHKPLMKYATKGISKASCYTKVRATCNEDGTNCKINSIKETCPTSKTTIVMG